MTIQINGLAYRITQTLIISVGLAMIWLYQYASRPQPEFHRVNFGQNAHLISVTHTAETVSRGKMLEFSIRWWLLAPLAPWEYTQITEHFGTEKQCTHC